MNLVHRLPAQAPWLVPLAVGAALRIYGLDWGMPNPLEEATPFYRAWGMWNWSDGSGLDFDPHFYRYPSLVFYVQWLLQAIHVGLAALRGGGDALVGIPAAFVVDHGPMLRLARTVGAVFGVATVAGTFALGRALGGRSVGVIASLAVAVNALLIRQAQMIDVDTASACFVTWGLWACVRIAQRGEGRDYRWAGAFLGLATSAKYPGAFLLLPMIVAHIVALRSRGSGGAHWRRAGLAALIAFVAFAATSPYVVVNLERAWSDVSAERTHMQEGHFGDEEGSAHIYYLIALARWILGPLGALAGLIGALHVFQRRTTPGVPLVSFVVMVLIVIGGWSTRADRYILNIVPALWVLAALPAAELGKRRRWVGVAAGLALIVSSAWALPSVYSRTRPSTRSLACNWIEEKIPEGAFLLMEAWGPDLLEPDDLWTDLSRESRAIALDSGRPIYAVQVLPMFQTAPELSEAFYDVPLHPDADLVVLSSDVSDRYRREPERFARQLQFYREVERVYTRMAQFDEASGPGPTITIYLRTDRRSTFARRGERAGPQPLRDGLRRPAEGESSWYQHLGLNYESFGFRAEALEAYARALASPRVRPSVAMRVGKGMARCYLSVEDRAGAASAMRQAAEACAGTSESRVLMRMMAELQ